jgi:hypothetical protein
MRSALNVRLCHYLRVMRVMAPVEWSLGLPFPVRVAVAHGTPATETPEDISFSTWLESRARARRQAPAGAIERPLAA